MRNSLVFAKRRLLGSRVRGRKTVQREYELGQWQTLLNGKEWRKYGSIRDYISMRLDARPRICMVEGEVKRAKTSDYYEYRMRRVSRVITEHAGGVGEIVELGGGAGMNLFSLYAANVPFRTLIGLDVSENAIQAGREIASYFGISALTFDKIDLLNGEDRGFSQLHGKVVFTYYCLEQLHRKLDIVLDNILRARPRKVIHIEPTREILHPSSLLDLNSMLYSYAMDYPANLLSTLRSMADEGKIVIDAIERLDYAPTIRHFPVLAVWRPATG